MLNLNTLSSQLNAPQWEAVSHPGGPLLVLAGAGSGKTRVLTSRIAYLIGRLGVDPSSILALTFTNKAAIEMRKRMETILMDDASGIWIGTFHSICLRILRSHPGNLPVGADFTIYDADDQKRLAKSTAEDLGESPKRANALLYMTQRLKNDGITSENLLENSSLGSMAGAADRTLFAFYREYQKRLHEANALDFGDLLLAVSTMFSTHPQVADYYRRRFSHVLIDEYQDTNRVQFFLARDLTSEHKNLCVVGDDDQSIYSWRGADISNILCFREEFPDAKIIKLEQNYRSTQVILEAATSIVAKNPFRHKKELWTEKSGGAPVAVHEARTEEEEALWLVRNIQRLRSQGFKYSDIAILYRVHALSRPIEEAFIRENIPYAMFGGLRFYERMEIKDALAYLRFVINPEDIVSFRRIVNKPTRGIGAATVQTIENLARDHRQGLLAAIYRSIKEDVLGTRRGKAVAKFINLFENWRIMAKTAPLAELLKHILNSSGYLVSLDAQGDMQVETRRENLAELINAAEGIDSPETGGIVQFLDRTALVSTQDSNIDSETVSLMTLHSAKGLEFPIVFMAAMEDGIFPHHMSFSEDGGMDEERRLCYVGFTRAMERLYLTRSRVRRLYGVDGIVRDPSRFLLDLPQQKQKSERKTIGAAPRSIEIETQQFSKKTESNERYFVPEPGEAVFQNGMSVRHKKYGAGVIASVDGWGPRMKITVRFELAGTRKLLAHMANLEVLLDS